MMVGELTERVRELQLLHVTRDMQVGVCVCNLVRRLVLAASIIDSLALHSIDTYPLIEDSMARCCQATAAGGSIAAGAGNIEIGRVVCGL